MTAITPRSRRVRAHGRRTDGTAGSRTTRRHRHDPVYDRLHETAEFAELRRRYRGFVFPATVAFLAWYLLYVVMSQLGAPTS